MNFKHQDETSIKGKRNYHKIYISVKEEGEFSQGKKQVDRSVNEFLFCDGKLNDVRNVPSRGHWDREGGLKC